MALGHGNDKLLEEQEGWTALREGSANVRLHFGVLERTRDCRNALYPPPRPSSSLSWSIGRILPEAEELPR